MSYPGSMSRGKRPVVAATTKAKLEEFFVSQFPLHEVWASASEVADRFDSWHRRQVKNAALAIATNVRSNNLPMSVAAKFVNTYLYQLTKYPQAQPLLPVLHLPLDARVFKQLSQVESTALCSVRAYLRRSPYALPYAAHLRVQEALLGFIQELNSRPAVQQPIAWRIQLNWLWL